jgi:type I restriction enzyme S subunit
MTVKKAQKSLSTTLEKTEQTLGGLENSLGNNAEASLLATDVHSEANGKNTGLPEGWCLPLWDDITLGDGFRRGPFGGNLKKSNFVSEGYAVYEQYAPINDDCTKFRYFVTEEKYNELSSFWVSGGDFLVSCSGTMGRITQVPNDAPEGVINQALLRIRLDKKLMRDDLFLKLFRSPIIKNQVLNKTVGGAIQNLASVKELKTIEIPLPPLAEQAVIAQTLDTLLAQVDNIKIRLDAIPEILKTFRQSVLASAVSGKLTEEWRGNNECDEWKAVTLGEVGKGFNYGSSTKSQKEGDIPVLRMGNLQRGKLEWGNLVFTSDKDEIAKYLLEEGDVLFNRTNSPELVGKTSIYRGERKSIYAGYLIRVKGSDELNSEFLNILLNSPDAKSYCMTIKSDGVSQSNINAQKLRAFSFNNPSYEEQLQIVRRVEELLAFTDQIEQQVKNAQGRVNNLTQSILAKAFRGELTADWRAENPDLISGENSAGVLLVNIKEEREKLKPKKVTKKKAVRNPSVK